MAEQYDPMPLDYAVLAQLPKEGSRLGYHVLAATVKSVKENLNKDLPTEAWVTSDQVSARLREMKNHELAVDVRVQGSGGSRGWQITPQGEQLLATVNQEDQ